MAYVFLVSELVVSAFYLLVFFFIWAAFLSWSIEADKQGEVWKWGAIASTILGCLTTWITVLGS